MGASRTRSRRRDSAGQLTIGGFLDDLTRRVESDDARIPATRLLCIVLALMGIGLLVQASHAATTLSPEAYTQHLYSEVGFRVAGIVLLLLGYRLGPRHARRFLPALTLGVGVLLLLVFIPPFSAPRNGSYRWVDLGISFQPSELARVVLVLWVADRCVRLGAGVYDLRRGVLPMLALALLFFLLVLVETDLGGAMLLLICVLSTMWVGGARMLPMAGIFVAFGGGAITTLSLLVPYVRERVGMWIGSVHNDQVEGTLAALKAGGPLGAGFGQGLYRHAGVPYLDSDYVFAQIGEEWGLLGMWVVLALIAAFLWNSLRLVLSVRARYEALCAFGLTLSVAVQAMLHVQVVAGLAPPKGTTLPFISAGGTSLVVSSLAVGLALGAARRPSQEY